jgi:hypothetical protein
MKRKQYLKSHDISLHLNHYPKNVILELLAPAGSGKTFAVNKFLENYHKLDKYKNTNILIAHPYRVSKAEYAKAESYGYDVKYFMELIENINNRVPMDNIIYDEDKFLLAFEKEAINYFKEKNYTLAFLDEADFFFIQALAMRHGAIFQTLQDNEVSITATKLIMITLTAMTSTVDSVISISANKIIFPKDVAHTPNFNPYLLYTQIVNLKPNTMVNSFRIINLNEFSNAMPTLVKRRLIQKYKNTPSLVYSPKFTRPEFKMLMKEQVFFIVRDENTPKVKVKNKFYASILHDYKLSIPVGDYLQRDLLSDRHIKTHKMIAVNTSSTRALSLTDNYGLATIIIFTDIWTASVSQVCARFRNTPVDIIWITKKIQTLDTNHDLFMDDWLPQPNLLTKPLKEFSMKKSKTKPLGKIQKKILEAEPFFDLSKYKSIRAAYLAYKTVYPNGLSKNSFYKHYKLLTK